ncbi:sigma-70 family RNA polymerase sigma factor [Paenibacillus sp. HB172176]|uniref:sigma-70 family RNA polymerase sigma factor n=1 Tax=Paenibacillus sp. HB172176 TaxID=2493690 RepID=UPI00143A8907|nr:sigma-70 family RNA polymerase sigma factor [Paenibacillus sp. HB172176]
MRQGDQGAFGEVYNRINDHIYRMVYFLSRNKGEVEDIVNEVYIALFQALPTYDFNKPFRAWLNGLILRQTSNWKRKLWRKMKLNTRSWMVYAQQSPKQPEELVIEAENEYEMLVNVDKLSLKLREIIVLRYYQNSSYEEMAECLNIPLGTVKSRHHLAIRRLRKLIEIHSAGEEASIRVQ